VLQHDTWLVVILNIVVVLGEVSDASLEFSSRLVALSFKRRVVQELNLLNLGWRCVRRGRTSALSDGNTANERHRKSQLGDTSVHASEHLIGHAIIGC